LIEPECLLTTKGNESFRNQFGLDIFKAKYRNWEAGINTWDDLAKRLIEVVIGKTLPFKIRNGIYLAIRDMKFIPAGRYLYYAGREAKFWNNCFAFIAEDTREGWADLGSHHFSALMSGGGCGTSYSRLRPSGAIIHKTGGFASGVVPLISAMNEIGRNVTQGASRRSALYASLNWKHGDIIAFITCKDWSDAVKAAKEADVTYPAPMDMTNISVELDDEFFMVLEDKGHELHDHAVKVFDLAFRNMLTSAEPGFSINLGEDERSVARNA